MYITGGGDPAVDLHVICGHVLNTPATCRGKLFFEKPFMFPIFMHVVSKFPDSINQHVKKGRLSYCISHKSHLQLIFINYHHNLFYYNSLKFFKKKFRKLNKKDKNVIAQLAGFEPARA